MPALRLGARWLVPVLGPPVEGGAVLIADGRVVAAGRDADVPRPAGAASVDCGDAAILPGLVNAHSHLELTALRGLVRDLPFPRWVATVRRLKEAQRPEDFRASARWGVLEGFAAGITATGDTGTSGAPAAALAALGGRGVVYLEVIEPDPARAADALRTFAAALERLRESVPPGVRLGVSPHAPYTVSEPLLREAVAFARERGLPLAMHLAESAEEVRYVRDGEGPIADAWRRRGIAVAARGRSPVSYAAHAGFLGRDALAIHCVQTDPDDAAALAASGTAVAHCPWSNHALGNGRAPLALLRGAGVTVGLGTDSVAAGGGLDLFREMRLAAGLAPLAPREALRLATAAAAAALGLAGAGTLEPGARGDACVVSLAGPPHAAAQPEESLVHAATPADVRLTVAGGTLVWQDGRWPGVDAAAERTALEAAAERARAAAAAAD